MVTITQVAEQKIQELMAEEKDVVGLAGVCPWRRVPWLSVRDGL